MNIFNNATTWTKQGDIGEARAIYEYTKLGYGVSKPLNDSMKYDLIIDKNGELFKVQVKTTKFKNEKGIYYASLKTSGGNRSGNNIKNREDSDYDILFVLTETDKCYSIPVTSIKAKSNIALGSLVEQFEL